MDEQLTAGAEPRMVVLCGIAGVGKTSLAAEYAHRRLPEVGIAWQIPSENISVAEQSMAELAAQAGGRHQLDPRDPVASVHALLRAYPAEWLLIFDNAVDESSVRRFLPPAGRGRVLISSRNEHWGVAPVLRVPVLDIDAATQFLIGRTADPDRSTAVELASELGGLPLALEQAAAYIRASDNSMRNYLGEFRIRRADLLDRGMPSAHPEGVTATLALAMSRLAQSAPLAAGLLRLLAFLAPEPVPLSYLLTDRDIPGGLNAEVASVLRPLATDGLAASDALVALRQNSLVTAAGNGMVLMHRLVQDVIREQLTTDVEAAWRQAVAALVEAAVPLDTESPAAWRASAALLPHALVALDLTSAAIGRIAVSIGNSGRYAAARDLHRQIVSAQEDAENYSPEHVTTLARRANLAYWTGNAGDPAAARQEYERLQPICERVLGPEHSGTLTVRANVARWTGNAGDKAAARDLYANLVPIRERVSGPEHPDTLLARASLADLTGEAGDAAAARDLYAQLLPIYERISGPEDQIMLTVRANLARWTGEAGEAAAARDLYALLLPIRERVSGPEHPHTLQERAGLARWTGEAGDPAAARDLYAQLLPIRERVSGPEHPDTLQVRLNLGYCTGEAGNAPAARDQLTALMPICEQVFGGEHPATLSARAILARWTGYAGDPVAARDQFAALLPIRERVSGPDHPSTLMVRAGLADWTGEAGYPAVARDLYAELMPVRERVSGPDHPQTLTDRANLARWTRKAAEAAF